MGEWSWVSGHLPSASTPILPFPPAFLAGRCSSPLLFLGLQKGESCHVHGLMKTFFLNRKVLSGSNWIRAPQPGRQL